MAYYQRAPSPSPYAGAPRAPSPLPYGLLSPVPPTQALPNSGPGGQIQPGTITYTTSTSPDGKTTYHPFKAVPVSYRTANGVVSGVQWVPAEATSVMPAGAQLANSDIMSSWSRGNRDDKTLRKWQKDEKDRIRKEEKEAVMRLNLKKAIDAQSRVGSPCGPYTNAIDFGRGRNASVGEYKRSPYQPSIAPPSPNMGATNQHEHESDVPGQRTSSPDYVDVEIPQRSPVSTSSSNFPSWLPRRPPPPAPGSTLHSLSTAMMFDSSGGAGAGGPAGHHPAGAAGASASEDRRQHQRHFPEPAILSRSRAPSPNPMGGPGPGIYGQRAPSPVPGAMPPYGGNRSRAPSPIPGAVPPTQYPQPLNRPRAPSPLPGAPPPTNGGQPGSPYVNALPRSPRVPEGHVSTSQSSPSRILEPPEKLHPTLSCWIKNMKKLSGLIDRLQQLASSAPTEHQSQLLRQVKGLRATSRKQQEHFIDFLKLSEEYANEYLLDIDAYIQQQSTFLANLERRLETAKKLRGEAAELQMLYESGTVATMNNLRATALPRPLPEDDALFREVDSVLTEIKNCYTELYKFWTEEISRAMEAFEKRRVDRTDLERWRNFHANLKQAIESWKSELPSSDAQTVLRNNACLSREADIGTIASSLSSTMSSVTSALERIPSTNSLKYLPSCQSPIRRVYLALRGNRDLCLSFLRRCADYGENVIGCRLSSTALPTPFRVMASHDLRERTMRLLSVTTDVSVENAASVQGSRKFKAAYKKARSLEEKTTSRLNTLLEPWTTVTDGHAFPDDDFPDVIIPDQLRELWEKARYSVRVALANLRDEPAPQLFYRSAPLVSTRLQSVMRRWMMRLVFFS